MDAKEIYYESLLTKMLFQKSSIKKIPLSGTDLLKYTRADVKKSDLEKNIMLRGTALQ